MKKKLKDKLINLKVEIKWKFNGLIGTLSFYGETVSDYFIKKWDNLLGN